MKILEDFLNYWKIFEVYLFEWQWVVELDRNLVKMIIFGFFCCILSQYVVGQ